MFLTVPFFITTLPQMFIIESMLNDYTLFYYVFTSCHISFKSETFVIALWTFSSLDFAISLAFSYFGDTTFSQSLINFSKNLKCNIVCIKNGYNKCELSQKSIQRNKFSKQSKHWLVLIIHITFYVLPIFFPYFFQWRRLTLV